MEYMPYHQNRLSLCLLSLCISKRIFFKHFLNNVR